MVRNKRFVLAVLILALLSMSIMDRSPVQASWLNMAVPPKADSDVTSEFPDWNRGRAWTLSVVGDGIEFLTFLMFDLSQVPPNSSVGKSTLRLHAHSVSVGGLVGVYYCPSNDWSEEGITYNNKPSYSTDPNDVANVTTKYTWYEWNVTEAAESSIKAGERSLSLVLKADTRVSIEFDSKEGPESGPPNYENRPQLAVQYLPPPPNENNLFPTIIVIAVIAAAATILGVSYLILRRRKSSTTTQRNTQLHCARNDFKVVT